MNKQNDQIEELTQVLEYKLEIYQKKALEYGNLYAYTEALRNQIQANTIEDVLLTIKNILK